MSSYLDREVESLLKIWGDERTYNVEKIQELGDRVVRAFDRKGLLAFAGNGGSAAEASHLAAEFTGRCVRDHRPLPAINLGESVAAFSAATNDYTFENSLVRTSQALLNENSVLIALSTSGSSPNIIKLIEDSISRGIYTVLWTSLRYEREKNTSNLEVWKANTESTPRSQEIHLLWGHLLSEYVENSIQ